MKKIIIKQNTQSVHHTNGKVGSQKDWELTELGKEQVNKIDKKLKEELGSKFMYSSNLFLTKTYCRNHRKTFKY